MKKNTALFDLDGTLFSTDEVNYGAYNKAIIEYGFGELDYNFFVTECASHSYRSFIPRIIQNSKNDGSHENIELIEAIHNLKKKSYSEFIPLSRVNTHLFNMIDLLKPTHNLAIVSNASKSNCIEILDYYNKTQLFDLIVTNEDVTKHKPDPECFNYAMQKLGATPESTMIFEDSPVGIEAAIKSKATVFTIANF